jgi:hypothetical protein
MNQLRIAIAALVAIALAGCSDDTGETRKTIPADLCAELGVVCDDPTGKVTCDPADGLCKCGGAGGVVCDPGTVCQIDGSFTPPAPSCLSERCDDVGCAPFEVCDSADGRCKCRGVECGPGQTCLADGCSGEDPCAGVICEGNQVCDPSDRTCKCGGQICSAGESCRIDDGGQGHCVGRRCVGRNCPDGTACNPADGLCHCGNPDGDVCMAGQSCGAGDDATRCLGRNPCEDVECPGNTTCSPLDGRCRCGGFDATAPICTADQTCDPSLDPARCLGGDACRDVVCEADTNLSCDGETGECRCGGTGGIACGAGEGCVGADGQPTCVTLCDPNASNVSVEVCGHRPGMARSCYLSPADGIAYCAAAGNQPEGSDCHAPTDCASGHHCVDTGTGTRGVCRRYCDTAVENSCYRDDLICVPLAGRPGNLPRLGVCMTVSP